MKILFCDWHGWVFPKNNHPLKKYFKELGIECIDVKPCEIGHSSRQLIEPILIDRPIVTRYRGFNIDNFIKVENVFETGWYYSTPEIQDKYRKWAMYLIDWAFNTYKKHQPDYIVIEGGLTYLSRVMGEVARELGIKVIALENSFIKNKFFIDFNTGYIVNRHLFARCSQDWIDTRYLTKEKNELVEQYIKDVFSNLNQPTTGIVDIKLKYNKTIFVPLQYFADQVTLYDSKYNNEQFLTKIIDLAKTEFSDWNIILKCHPREERNPPKSTGNWLEKQKLPKNITLIRGAGGSANTQELIKMADLVMVNTSQAGLEACLLKKLVVVFGDAFYSKKGFTIEYKENLDWSLIKNNTEYFINYEAVKIWFYYFYRWLYNKELQEVDKQRMRRELNI
jgi:capsule polysaccharide export protein KpsC/LpsZ